MRVTSNRELARQLGVSETAVRRAEKAGRIRRGADGAWDLATAKAAWASNTDQAQQRGGPSAGNGTRSATRRAVKPVPEAALGAVRDTLREHGEPVSAGSMTFMQARTANEVLKAQERRVRLQRMKGELVDRAKAVAQVFRLARDERDAWINWPARVAASVDAGYATQDVYAWVRQHPQASWGPAGAAARQARTAVAVKGRNQDTALLLSVSKADAGGKRRGLRVWWVGTPVAKGELYRWLKLEWPTEEALEEGASYPPGACHFPQYGEEYFKQLTAERLVTRIVKGFPRGSWEKEPGRRNEALDCRVYVRAAAAIYGLDRFEERHWRRMEEALARTVERDDHEPGSPRTSVVHPPARRVIHSGYMAR